MSLIFSRLGTAGRLGNQLWQIASTIGIAESQGTSPRFPHWDYASFFSVPQEYFLDPSLLHGTESYASAARISDSMRVYMQDYGLIQSVEARIRAFFKPSPLALHELEAVKWFHELPKPLLSLHVRRGDLLIQDPVILPLRSIHYYQQAANLHPNDTIIVFSDDIEWCRRKLPLALKGRRLFFFAGVPRPSSWTAAYRSAPVLDWIDLQLMALCDHHIISNSTLAWWGALLSGDAQPIYPSNWYAPSVSWRAEAAFMFPPGWREVEDPTQGPPLLRRLKRSPLARMVPRSWRPWLARLAGEVPITR